MKKLILCFDGTWNDIDAPHATNVAKIAQSVSRADEDGNGQLIYYDSGVGTFDFEGRTSDVANLLSGALGWGLRENIEEAYAWLVLNYEPGDSIFVFGFSRGAFTARSLCGLVRNVGIVDRRHLRNLHEAMELYISREPDASPDTDYCREFRRQRQTGTCLQRDRDWLVANYPDDGHERDAAIQISYLGVWDTVGALGLPVPDAVSDWVNEEYGFHDTRLSTFVERARHAVAADEERNTFSPALWSNIDELRQNFGDRYDEKIFPGTHSSVGGGGPIVGLSDAALQWVLQGAQAAGLRFDDDEDSPIYRLQPNHLASIHNVPDKVDFSLKDWLIGVGTSVREFPHLTADDLHDSVINRYHDPRTKNLPDGEYRPPSLKVIFEDIENRKIEIKANLDDGDKSLLTEDGLLRLPDKEIEHIVESGDTLFDIAAKYYGDGNAYNLIFVYNFQLNLLHNADQLYLGRTLKIPIYEDAAL